MSLLLFLLIVLGFVISYALLLRPLLRRFPALQEFYSEAEGFWAKVWALSGKSVTVLWGYIIGGVGSLFALLDEIGPMVGDPDLNLKQQVQDGLRDNPKIAGYILIGISLVTIAARLRTIGKSA